MTTGTNGAGPERPWRVGEHILWRYRAWPRSLPGTPAPGEDPGAGVPEAAFHICRPVTVVEDSPDLLAVWLAGDTVCVKPTLMDGTPIHLEPLATRYTRPRTVVHAPWTGTGVLKLARPGDPWSVWLFWDLHWRFKNWYVNLEEPRRRWPGGVDSEDHFLDIAVYPDRSWEWRDEDEFAQAQQAGLLGAAQAERVRDAGEAAIRLISDWDWPFGEKWTRWRPDPGWQTPRLPADWDRPAPSTSRP